jgi:hypothetical protein
MVDMAVQSEDQYGVHFLRIACVCGRNRFEFLLAYKKAYGRRGYEAKRCPCM